MEDAGENIPFEVANSEATCPEVSGGGGAPETAITRLGQALYDQMEHLAPDASDHVVWDRLPAHTKELFVLAVEHLIDVYPDLLEQALANNNGVGRGPKIVE